MENLNKQPNESNQAHYARLLKLTQTIEPILRRAKRAASRDVNEAAAKARYNRDMKKIADSAGEPSDSE